MSNYKRGVDVLGDGIGDFLPFVNILSGVGGMLGGKKDAAKSGGGDTQQAAIQKALQQEHARQEMEKLKADAARNQMLLFGALGLGGLGVIALFLTRRK